MAFCLAPRVVIVGNVGQLRKDGEGSDQQSQIAVGQMAELPYQRDGRTSLAMLIDNMAAQIFDPVEGGLSVLFADDFAQLSTEQPDSLAACRGRGLCRD